MAYHELESHRHWHHGHDNDLRITLTVHRHDHSEGFHLHGIIDPNGDEYGAGDGIKNFEGYKRWRHDDGDHHVSDKVGDTLWLLAHFAVDTASGDWRQASSRQQAFRMVAIDDLVPVAGGLCCLYSCSCREMTTKTGTDKAKSRRQISMLERHRSSQKRLLRCGRIDGQQPVAEPGPPAHFS